MGKFKMPLDACIKHDNYLMYKVRGHSFEDQINVILVLLKCIKCFQFR